VAARWRRGGAGGKYLGGMAAARRKNMQAQRHRAACLRRRWRGICGSGAKRRHHPSQAESNKAALTAEIRCRGGLYGENAAARHHGGGAWRGDGGEMFAALGKRMRKAAAAIISSRQQVKHRVAALIGTGVLAARRLRRIENWRRRPAEAVAASAGTGIGENCGGNQRPAA